MAIENIEDYWRGKTNFGLRRQECVVVVDCRDTDIEDIIPRQRIKMSSTPVPLSDGLCELSFKEY